MKKMTLAIFVVLALFFCALFFLLVQVVHADSPSPHGGHTPVVSNGQGQVSKGNDPVPHVNYGLHKGQNKDATPVPVAESAATPVVPMIQPVPQSTPKSQIIPPAATPVPVDKSDWALYPVCQTGLTTDITLSEPDGEHALCFYGWYSTGGR